MLMVSSTYSTTVKVAGQITDMQLSAIVPNPASNIAQLNITTTKKDKVDLSIISPEGKVVYKNAVELQAGSSIINLEISNLAKGTYFVRGIFSDGQASMIKFVKQ
ncbi:MAG: T9SS type A sorting domain-containing protein [Ferruginibacter sp.]